MGLAVRRIFSLAISFTLAMPASAFARPAQRPRVAGEIQPYTKTVQSHGRTFISYREPNATGKGSKQILLNPDLQLIKVDSTGSGYADYWQASQGGLTVIARYPHHGQFTYLTYKMQSADGVVIANFHLKTRHTYALDDVRFVKTRAYAADGSSFAGDRSSLTCDDRTNLGRFDSFAKKLGAREGQQIEDALACQINRMAYLFFDKTCFDKQDSSGENYANSVPVMAKGLAKVIASSWAKPTKDQRYLACLDQNNMAPLAAQMRANILMRFDSIDNLLSKNGVSDSDIESLKHISSPPTASDCAMQTTVSSPPKSLKDMQLNDKSALPEYRHRMFACQALGTDRSAYQASNGPYTLYPHSIILRQTAKRATGYLPGTTGANAYATDILHEMTHEVGIEDEDTPGTIEACCGQNDSGKNLPNFCARFKRNNARNAQVADIDSTFIDGFGGQTPSQSTTASAYSTITESWGHMMSADDAKALREKLEGYISEQVYQGTFVQSMTAAGCLAKNLSSAKIQDCNQRFQSEVQKHVREFFSSQNQCGAIALTTRFLNATYRSNTKSLSDATNFCVKNLEPEFESAYFAQPVQGVRRTYESMRFASAVTQSSPSTMDDPDSTAPIGNLIATDRDSDPLGKIGVTPLGLPPGSVPRSAPTRSSDPSSTTTETAATKSADARGKDREVVTGSIGATQVNAAVSRATGPTAAAPQPPPSTRAAIAKIDANPTAATNPVAAPKPALPSSVPVPVATGLTTADDIQITKPIDISAALASLPSPPTITSASNPDGVAQAPAAPVAAEVPTAHDSAPLGSTSGRGDSVDRDSHVAGSVVNSVADGFQRMALPEANASSGRPSTSSIISGIASSLSGRTIANPFDPVSSGAPIAAPFVSAASAPAKIDDTQNQYSTTSTTNTSQPQRVAARAPVRSGAASIGGGGGGSSSGTSGSDGGAPGGAASRSTAVSPPPPPADKLDDDPNKTPSTEPDRTNYGATTNAPNYRSSSGSRMPSSSTAATRSWKMPSAQQTSSYLAGTYDSVKNCVGRSDCYSNLNSTLKAYKWNVRLHDGRTVGAPNATACWAYDQALSHLKSIACSPAGRK